jgi:MurNAc alpha-1-phosphate uridylyltransferase
MKAMIFAAGLGTRLKPWTDHHPKALAVVNGKSLLQRNIEYLQSFGINEVVVNVHHFADQIEEAIYKNKGWGSNVVISDEREAVLETGGGLLKARSHFYDQPVFLTMNADLLTNLNLHSIIAEHLASKCMVTLAVMTRESSRQLLFDRINHLRGWRNKLTGVEKGEVAILDITEPLKEMAFSGISVFSNDIFKLMPEEGKFSLTDFFLQLAPTCTIGGYNHTGDLFLDVGTQEKLEKAAIAISGIRH